jgi:CBS domain containing-hemolysin-like protein
MPDDSRQSSAASTPGLLSRLAEMIGLRSASVREDIADALSQPALNTDLSAKERAMLRNVLALREHRVADVMVPRADIVAVAADTSLSELLNIFRTANHSRLPVYGETLDDPRGMIHIRDFLDFLASRSKNRRRRRKGVEIAAPQALDNIDLSIPVSAARILRPVLYVPPSMPAVDLLVRMQATRTHMALVIDEYGGTDGLVSIEDLVEIIVGEIEDEHDFEEAPMVTTDAEGRITADARVPLADISASLGVDLATLELAEEVDTLGGLVTSLAGRVPVRGEMVIGPDGLEFEVMDADPRKLKRVRIHPKARAAAAPAPNGSAT